MARVSLILPTMTAGPSLAETLPALRGALEADGHEVEVVFAGGPGQPPVDVSGTRWVEAPVSGRAAAAIAGLQQAGGEILIVLDPETAYDPSELPRVAAPLAEGRADVVIASRLAPGTGPLRAALGAAIRPLVGTTDPMSGLIGLSRAGLDSAGTSFRAVGRKFSFEILAKIGNRRSLRWLDIPVRSGRSTSLANIGWDDIRHLKRLSDHRFGNISRLVQFCLVGASGAVVDLSAYALLQWVFARTPMAGITLPSYFIGGPLYVAVAAVLAVAIAIVWNFSLNRRLTFNDARDGSIAHQFFKYLMSNALSVPLSVFLRLKLPLWVEFFDQHKLAAAAVGILAGMGISFSMSRWVVFRRASESVPAPEPDGGPAAAPTSSTLSATSSLEKGRSGHNLARTRATLTVQAGSRTAGRR
jgi:dolichol-phosphate mannosyltransferase